MVMSPERRVLTTMKVSADMFCVMAPPRTPHKSVAAGCEVHRVATLRSGQLAKLLRFSVRSHIPAANSPRPPAMLAKKSIMGSVG